MWRVSFTKAAARARCSAGFSEEQTSRVVLGFTSWILSDLCSCLGQRVF